MESDKKKEGLDPSPRASSNPFSSLTFAWTTPLFRKGYKRDLEMSDLYQPLKDHKSNLLGDKFERLWEDEKKKKSPSLLWVIIRCYGFQCAMYGLLLFFMECCLRLIQPWFLGKMISFSAANHTQVSSGEAYMHAAGVVACSALNVFMVHPYMMGILHMGMKFRVACCSLIYRKALKLSKTALGETTVGQVVNLLSNDVNRFDVAIIFLHYLWIGPLQTLLVTYLMWQQIGFSAVVGVIFMLLFIPLQGWLGKRTSVLRLRTALRTDERVRLMNEIISGILVIKMYTWEDPFAQLVSLARKREIKEIRATSYIKGVLISFIMFVTRVSLFLSILSYVLDGEAISAKTVFVVTSYYNLLRQTMTVFFPQGIAQIAEANISIRRLQKFMLYEETTKPPPPPSSEMKNGKPPIEKPNGKSMTGLDSEVKFINIKSEAQKEEGDGGIPRGIGKFRNLDEDEKMEAMDDASKNLVGSDKPAIVLNNVTAKWVGEQSDDTLSNITMKVKPGSLVAVIGPVGAGKSSLFNVILEELPLASGTLQVNGSIAYASQEPWLFVGSIRQNILFGAPMERARYNMVVRKCALERDFSLFPRGDKTIVGERGVSLSGGQRARINLARAVYRRADIFLLDDPLSAVDAHVGRQLFDSCVLGFLRPATRILITHQLQYLNEVDHIIILKNGIIAAEGSFEALQASGLDFAELLKTGTEEEAHPELPLEAEDSSREFHRHLSFHSTTSVDESNLPPVESTEEQRSSGAVGGRVYAAYMRAAGSWALIAGLMALTVLAQVFASGSDYWTSYWVNVEESNVGTPLNGSLGAEPPSTLSTPLVDLGAGHFLTRVDFIYIYSGLIVTLVVLTMARSFMFFWLAMRASTSLHDSMFQAITRAHMRFFHTNPSGRILNRFSKDMGSIDEMLPSAIVDVLQIGLSLIGIVVVISIVNPWLLIPTVGVGYIFYLLRIYYLSTSRSVKRLEGVTRSPVFSHLSASLQGMSTIRAFHAQPALEAEFDAHQDLHSAAWYLFIATSRAFGFWLDLVCVLYIGLVTFSFFLMGEGALGGNVGLAITQAMGLTGMFQWGMRQSTELENQMTSVERVMEYNDIEKEPPLKSAEPPRETWPEQGALQVEDVWLRYAPGGEAALRGLTFSLQPRDKLGIVGRTGAGKSSIISALFRLAYSEGKMEIDGLDTGALGLHDLRGKISIIPQEPVLFSGTMRKNLDPFNQYTDEVLWKALEEVEIKEAVLELEGGLNSKMSEGGTNFSVGQRQLVCLARAIVRRNRILVMDEATANVDPQTDALIQTTIRKKFADCTVLTIAHRLHTVMDSDKVLVMDAGKAVECDHPHILLQREDGVFRSMVNQTGRSMSETLMKIAQQCYERQMKSKSE